LPNYWRMSISFDQSSRIAALWRKITGKFVQRMCWVAPNRRMKFVCIWPAIMAISVTCTVLFPIIWPFTRVWAHRHSSLPLFWNRSAAVLAAHPSLPSCASAFCWVWALALSFFAHLTNIHFNRNIFPILSRYLNHSLRLHRRCSNCPSLHRCSRSHRFGRLKSHRFRPYHWNTVAAIVVYVLSAVYVLPFSI
jgi:hypothetical protein